MEVPANQVKSVYAAAARLKMERVVNHCARFLVDHLDPATAIEIRSLTGIQRNPELVSKVDSFLASQVQPLAFVSMWRIQSICSSFFSPLFRIRAALADFDPGDDTGAAEPAAGPGRIAGHHPGGDWAQRGQC
jgi:hypothetical protein